MRSTLLAMMMTFPAAASADGPPLAWELVTERAGWRARDSQGELVFNDRLWIFGGWFDSFEAPPRDVWNSRDGKQWTLVQPKAPWKHSDLGMTLVHDNRMWFMGGWFNGRLPGHEASAEVWSSKDGIDWDRATAKAGFSPRLAAAAVVFKKRMWILGGSENYYFGDEKSLRNDVWSSADGVKWERATEQAPWPPRAYHQAVVLNDRIHLFGGGNYVPKYQAFHDVWSSPDGVNWTRLPDAPWSPRLWFSAEVYRGRMWVLGGWSNNPSRNWGDVWHSKDGQHWRELKTTRSWKERHEHSVFVKDEKLWVAGGHAQPLSSEVWSLHVPPDWFDDATEPSAK